MAGRVRLATSFWARFRGLMGSAPLDADEGLYLPVNSIHMLFMRFPIDAVFVDSPDPDGRPAGRRASARTCPPGAAW